MARTFSEDSDAILTNAATPATRTSQGSIGTPLTGDATRVVLLGAGELGKELAIELQRLGAEVIAVGSRDAEPAMQVAHRAHVVDLLDSDALLNVLAIERPHIVVPEAGVIEPSVLGEIEDGGARVVPSALTTQIAMNREILRRVLAEDLGLPTPNYRFAASYPELMEAVEQVGLPAIVKPVRSSAGAGHSVVRTLGDGQSAWQMAVNGGWFSSDDDGDREHRVIVEQNIAFDAELVVFVVRARGASALDALPGPVETEPAETAPAETLTVCPPIQVVDDAGFAAAWQPPDLPAATLAKCGELAQLAVSALPGLGVFAVELLVVGDAVLVSEVTPRVVSAGFTTLVAQDFSVFALQARAILGLPVDTPLVLTAGAARALWVEGLGKPVFSRLDAALATPATRVLLYGKPKATRRRSVGIVLATAPDAVTARENADQAATTIQIALDDGR